MTGFLKVNERPKNFVIPYSLPVIGSQNEWDGKREKTGRKEKGNRVNLNLGSYVEKP